MHAIAEFCGVQNVPSKRTGGICIAGEKIRDIRAEQVVLRHWPQADVVYPNKNRGAVDWDLRRSWRERPASHQIGRTGDRSSRSREVDGSEWLRGTRVIHVDRSLPEYGGVVLEVDG